MEKWLMIPRVQRERDVADSEIRSNLQANEEKKIDNASERETETSPANVAALWENFKW